MVVSGVRASITIVPLDLPGVLRRCAGLHPMPTPTQTPVARPPWPQRAAARRAPKITRWKSRLSRRRNEDRRTPLFRKLRARETFARRSETVPGRSWPGAGVHKIARVACLRKRFLGFPQGRQGRPRAVAAGAVMVSQALNCRSGSIRARPYMRAIRAMMRVSNRLSRPKFSQRSATMSAQLRSSA